MTGLDLSPDDDFSGFVVQALSGSPEPDPRRVDSAKELWELRIVGEELGRLVSDSAEVALAGVRRRGRTGDRDLMYSFEACEVSLRVDETRRLSGQVLGADPVAAELVSVDRRWPLEVGPHGRFIGMLSAGPFRVALTLADGAAVSTQWAVV